MSKQLFNLADKVIEFTRKFGEVQSEVVIKKNKDITAEARKENIDFSEVSHSTSISLRVIYNNKSALVSTSSTSESNLKKLASKALEIAKDSLENPYDIIAQKFEFADSSKIKNLEIFDNKTDELKNISFFEELAIAADKASLNDAKITNTDGSSAGRSDSEYILCTSNGFKDGYKKSSFYISSSAIAAENKKMEREFAFEQRTYLEDLPNPSEIGELAAERAINMLGATKPTTGNYPVIFNERISSSIVGHILSAINGETIIRGSSWLLKSLNKNIIPEKYSLIEDPHILRLSGSRPFDAEGLKTKRNKFIDNGVLKSWVMDLKTSSQLGLKSTANAIRSNSSLPYPGVGNIELVGGDLSLDDLLVMAGEGLMVCSMIGSSINQNNGDYSRGASGFWFKDGKISHPVNECTIAGNLTQMIKSMTIANDSKSHLSRRVPSILIKDMTIAGN